MSNVQIKSTGGSPQAPGGPVGTDGSTVIGDGTFGNLIRLPNGSGGGTVQAGTSGFFHPTTVGNVLRSVYNGTAGELAFERLLAKSPSLGDVTNINEFGPVGIRIPNDTLLTVQYSGVVELTTAEWDAGAGTTGGLVPDQTYYVSDKTAGKMITTSPLELSGSPSMIVGIALSPTQLLLQTGSIVTAPTYAAPVSIGPAKIVGNAVYISNTGDAVLAEANASGTSFIAGLIAAIDATLGIRYQDSGLFTLTTAEWDALVTGESGGLTPGAPYYLSAAAAGKLTATPPVATGSFVVYVGWAVSATTLQLRISAPVGPHS